MNLDALFSLNCGMYIISSGYNGKYNGMIINALVQVTAFPNQIIASVNKESLTLEYIKKSGLYNISVLDKDAPLQLIGLFGFQTGKNIDKFSKTQFILGKNGIPIVNDHIVSYVETKVVSKLDAGTHVLFLGEVLESEFLTKAEPMTYNYYRDVKGGKVPRTAATFHPEEADKAEIERHRCTVCGYIYDSRYGDPDSGIDCGVLFQDLPEDWVCPICGAKKGKFVKI
ncbi:MAG TPA: hypothetical protein DCY12_01565 [Candidatus Atribacteria bacterium]|nr:hypothetical protein [Candidatus Atribacteria bacterium]